MTINQSEFALKHVAADKGGKNDNTHVMISWKKREGFLSQSHFEKRRKRNITLTVSNGNFPNKKQA